MNKVLLITISLIGFLSSFIVSEEQGNQRAHYECSKPLKIDSSLFDVRKGETYFYFNLDLTPKNLKSQGFSWTVDNPKEYFTAYLINTSDSTFNADRQDGSLMMIQEAMNERGEWQPIEYWVYSGCGNSYFSPLSLATGSYVMIPIKRYSGSFKTQFRLKMKKDEELFYSQTFDGSIELSQFATENDMVNGILYHGPASYFEEE